MRVTIFLLCLLSAPGLLGCTHAELTAMREGATIKEAAAKNCVCIETMRNKQEYEPIAMHFKNLETRQYTIEQLTDKSIPSPQEAHLAASLYDELAECRSSLRAAIASVREDALPILAENERQDENIVIRIVQRQISWGEAAQAEQALTVATQEKIAAIDREWKTELKEENRAELEQRQVAVDSTVQYFQNQQIINAMDRPINTRCFATGMMVNCTTQ